MEAVQQATQAAAFDAASLIPDSDSTEVEITNPLNKRKTGIFITVLSRDSETYKDIQKAQSNSRFKQFGKSRSSAALTADELEEESMQLLVACTKGWRNMVLHGQELECSAANVRRVYTEVITIREQVDEAIHDRGNFKKR